VNAVQAPKVEPTRVLVVDDDPGLLRTLSSLLGARGYDVITATAGLDALETLLREKVDLVVLDLTLPDIDGVEVCARLRATSAVPVLVLSVRGGEEDKIRALDTGADDYVTKPFSASVLVARIAALLRRAHGSDEPPEPLVAGDLVIDFAARRVLRGGQAVRLTKTEWEILALLASQPDQVVRTKVIINRVWDPEFPSDVTTLRAHVFNLRKKIERHPAVPRHVLTEPGIGFRFSVRG
jgi:two-component system KDP operon response regulator KdpE